MVIEFEEAGTTIRNVATQVCRASYSLIQELVTLMNPKPDIACYWVK
jgi:hypothetical protein